MHSRVEQVLLINDAPSEIAPLIKILSSACDLHIADGAESGLRIANEFAIDLILMDTMMPSSSCTELFEKLANSEKTKDIPLIFAVGSHLSR